MHSRKKSSVILYLSYTGVSAKVWGVAVSRSSGSPTRNEPASSRLCKHPIPNKEALKSQKSNANPIWAGLSNSKIYV